MTATDTVPGSRRLRSGADAAAWAPAGALGLLVPRLRSWAALGLLVLLVCATVTNVVVLYTSPLLSLALAAVAAGVLALRRDELLRA